MAEVRTYSAGDPAGRFGSMLYREDIDTVCGSSSIDWAQLDGATVAVAGATGLIGTILTDVLMRKAQDGQYRIAVLALGRNEKKARSRLPYFGRDNFGFEQIDINIPSAAPSRAADIIIHCASTTHPQAYVSEPVETITSNVQGLKNLLDYACGGPGEGRHPAASRFSPARVLFASSVEIYGENRGDTDRFNENYCGIIDSNTLRAGYPEAKRCCEALCQAYAEQYGVPVYIPRLPRVYGPTMLPSDSKALSQFIKNAAAGEDIILKSPGTQQFSYLYGADAVEGMLHILTRCEPGEAYNLSDKRSDAVLRDLAGTVARESGTSVVYDIPDPAEAAGYSTATKALMDSSKLQSTGWAARYSISEGIRRTLLILRAARQTQCLPGTLQI